MSDGGASSELDPSGGSKSARGPTSATDASGNAHGPRRQLAPAAQRAPAGRDHARARPARAPRSGRPQYGARSGAWRGPPSSTADHRAPVPGRATRADVRERTPPSGARAQRGAFRLGHRVGVEHDPPGATAGDSGLQPIPSSVRGASRRTLGGDLEPRAQRRRDRRAAGEVPEAVRGPPVGDHAKRSSRDRRMRRRVRVPRARGLVGARPPARGRGRRGRARRERAVRARQPRLVVSHGYRHILRRDVLDRSRTA